MSTISAVEYRMLIDGSLATFEAFNPATHEVIASVPSATREQLDAAVDAAGRAFVGWSQTPLGERQAAVAAMADRLEERAEEFMALLTLEQGKPRGGAEWEVLGSVAWLRAIATQSLQDDVLVDDVVAQGRGA